LLCQGGYPGKKTVGTQDSRRMMAMNRSKFDATEQEELIVPFDFLPGSGGVINF
jgi:hypothetical protein